MIDLEGRHVLLKRFILITVALAAGTPAAASGQRLIVEVSSDSSDILLPDVSVFVLQGTDTVGIGFTGRDGRVVFDLDRSGQFTVVGGGIGWAETIVSVNVAQRERALVKLTVGRHPVRLAPLQAAATTRGTWNSEHPWWEWAFRERQEWYGRLGSGRFYTKSQLRAYVNSHAFITDRVRYRPLSITSDCRPQGGGWAVHVDGSPVQEDVLDFIHPSDLFAVEVYTGTANIPAELAGIAKPCGAIVLWTRRDYR
jgi:hypothetical protein